MSSHHPLAPFYAGLVRGTEITENSAKKVTIFARSVDRPKALALRGTKPMALSTSSLLNPEPLNLEPFVFCASVVNSLVVVVVTKIGKRTREI